MYYNNSGGVMKEIIDTFVTNSTTILTSYGPFAGIIMIVLESIIPALPLSVFITLNMVAFGSFWGFIISWLSTIVGCMISFFLFRKLFRNKLERYVKRKNSKQLNKIMDGISSITFSNLVVLIAIPFSPASWINVGAALSKIKTKEFFWAVVLGTTCRETAKPDRTLRKEDRFVFRIPMATFPSDSGYRMIRSR